MKIDLKQLKKEPQGTAGFTIVESLPDEFLGSLGGRFIGPVKVDLTVDFTGQIYVGRGRLEAELEFACSRCLTPFTFSIAAPLHLVMTEVDSQKLHDYGDEALPVREGRVDIEPGIRAAVFAVMPFKPLCDPECRGLCPACGVNRNKEICHCRDDDTDPRWEALKKLIGEGGE